MGEHYLYGSVTRIAGLQGRHFALAARPRADWHTGDYVVGEVLADAPRTYTLEWPDGRMGEVLPGDRVVGALGSRCATIELVGDWRAIGDDLQMEALTAAGVFGRCTSRAPTTPSPMPLRYVGHVLLDGAAARMRDFVATPRARQFAVPVVQIVGTSMECGKTTAAKVVVRRLRQRGLRVAGIKLTGVGRYRDVLAMRDAGAAAVFDFVDVGLPSSLLEPAAFGDHVDRLLRLVADAGVDVVVAEAGASPMEPYNGEVAMQRLAPHVRLTLLAASDVYAVLGAIGHLSVRPDLVVGRVASTSAGCSIVEQLTGLRALNPLDPASFPPLDAVLTASLPELLPAEAAPRAPSSRRGPAGRTAGGAAPGGSGNEIADRVTKEAPMSTLCAAQIMRQPALAATRKAPVRDVITHLVANGISGLPVTEPDGRVIGVVTENDILRALVEGDPLGRLLAEDIMSTDPIVVDVTTPVSEVMHTLYNEGILRVPVTEDGRLVGIISRGDIIRAVAAMEMADEPDFLTFSPAD